MLCLNSFPKHRGLKITFHTLKKKKHSFLVKFSMPNTLPEFPGLSFAKVSILLLNNDIIMNSEFILETCWTMRTHLFCCFLFVSIPLCTGFFYFKKLYTSYIISQPIVWLFSLSNCSLFPIHFLIFGWMRPLYMYLPPNFKILYLHLDIMCITV